MHLATERLLLPPLRLEHAAALTAVYADPEVSRYIGGGALDADGTTAQVKRFESVWRELGWGQSAVIERASGAFLGRVGLHPWPAWDEVEVGWVLARHAQGQGYATEAATAWLTVAFGQLGLARVTAVVHPANARSCALAQRLGFHLHRRDATPGGVEVLVLERRAPQSEPTAHP